MRSDPQAALELQFAAQEIRQVAKEIENESKFCLTRRRSLMLQWVATLRSIAKAVEP